MKTYTIIGVIVVLLIALWLVLAPREEDEVVLPGEKEIELQPIELVEQTVTTSDGEELAFRLAKGFDIAIAAEDLGKARFMAMSPDGRLFVPDLVDYKLSHQGKLYILDDFNEETHQFETKHTYLSGLRGPNSVAFYRDTEGKDWLYLALTAHLLRYPYTAGDLEPSGEPEIVTTFPNTQTPGETSVVWHITRTLLFHNDQLYIAIGSGCNSCEHLEGELRGMIMVMDPDGENARVYGDGLRNSVGIAWANGGLYTTVNGADHLGEDKPDELMYRIEDGAHYGWPYCYQSNGVTYEDNHTAWKTPVSCEAVPAPLAAFTPRSAPLGLMFFQDIHPLLDSTFLVALHGSFEPEMRSGYQVVRVDLNGMQDVFMDGFQKPDDSRIARPVDFLQKDEDSFFMTDDHGGRVFYVFESTE